jgi:hypothetical protein
MNGQTIQQFSNSAPQQQQLRSNYAILCYEASQ